MTQPTHSEVPNERQELQFIAFCAINIVLALVMFKIPFLANVHNAATVLAGLSFGARRRFDYVAYTAAYIVGAELVWRVCHATLSYESGKYSLVAVCGFALWVMGRWSPKLPILLYFSLLLPSVLLTILDYPADQARQELSFNLSGPLALTVATLFLANIRLSREQLSKLLVAVLAPILGVAVITVYSTLSAASISFANDSNFVTSGGFGPNQVSSVLGLGIFVALFYVLFLPCGRIFQLFAMGSVLLCAVQSAMTFSRNGLYSAAGTALIMAVFGIRLPGVRTRLLFCGGVVALLGVLVIFPRLNRFTGGKLEDRFSNTKTTGRDDLVRDDLRIWGEHPYYGVGPGRARQYRHMWGTHWSAHTEYSRLLSEHGVFGIAAMLLLLGSAVGGVLHARDAQMRALTTSLFAWTFLYMAVNAMRVAAPSFTYALAFANFMPAAVEMLRNRKATRLRYGAMGGGRDPYARQIDRTA